MNLEIMWSKIIVLPCNVLCNGMHGAKQVRLNESCKMGCLHKAPKEAILFFSKFVV